MIIVSHTLNNMSTKIIDNEYIYDDNIDIIKEYKETIERRKNRTINNKIFVKIINKKDQASDAISILNVNLFH